MSKYIKLEDAIERLNQLYHGYEVEAWLESLPTIESNEDAISRKGIKIRLGKRFSDDPRRIMEIVKETVDDAPSVIPKPKEGEWIVDMPNYKSICPVCGAKETEFIYGTEMWYGLGESKFCPNCGAKMKGVDDE